MKYFSRLEPSPKNKNGQMYHNSVWIPSLPRYNPKYFESLGIAEIFFSQSVLLVHKYETKWVFSFTLIN